MLWENAAAADEEEEEEPLEQVPHSAPFSLSSPITGTAGAISARRSWAWREKMRSLGRQLMPRRGSCDDLNVAIATASVTPAKRAKSFPESKERGNEKGARRGRSRADSRGVWRSVYEPRWLEEGLAETSGDDERRPHGANRNEMGVRNDTAQRAGESGLAGREGSARYQLLRHNSLPCAAAPWRTAPSMPPTPIPVLRGDSAAPSECSPTGGDASVCSPADSNDSSGERRNTGAKRADWRTSRRSPAEGWTLSSGTPTEGGQSSAKWRSGAMRMGGEQADVIREKAVTMADAADAVASSEAAFKGDEALGGSTGAAEELEEGAERGTDGGEAEGKGEGGQGGEGGEGEEGGGGGGEVPMPLRVYMLPLTGELNFHVLLVRPPATPQYCTPHSLPSLLVTSPHAAPCHCATQRWRFANRVAVQLQHGMPADWQFKGNSLRPRADGDVVGFMVQDDGWMEGGQGEGGGGGGGGGGEGLVQVPQFVEGFGVHIEQYAAEYWLTLSLLAGGLPSVQRVRRAEDAHIIFVPAFSSAFYATQMKTNERRRRAGDTRIPEEQHLLAAVTQHSLWGDGGGLGGGASQGAKGQQGEGELLEKVEVATGKGSPGGSGAGEAGRQQQTTAAAGAERGAEGEGSGRGRAGAECSAVHPHALSTVRHEVAAAHMLMVDFSQPAEQVAHLNKDVLVPYSALIPPFLNDSLPGETEGGQGSVGGAEAVAAWAAARPTLIFFRGTLNRQQGGAMRVQLARLLVNVSGADIAEGSPLQGGVQAATAGMRASKFCLVPEGDTASSCRLFDAILSHCIPLVVSDSLDLPFEEALDYTAFALFLPQALALRPGYVEAFLQNVSHESAFAMWQRLREVAHHFVYSTPPTPGGRRT
ncbi:unnamed protein product [Closterium sp. NIES-65]|nr:unnamed protein product [Closterium sp. NIES-65]